MKSASEILLQNYGTERFADTTEEIAKQKLSRFDLFDLEQYDGQEPLIDFAWRHVSEAVMPVHSMTIENPVIIPKGLKHELKLCRNEQGQFFIRRHNRTRIFRLVGMQKPALNTVWELYLAGLNIHFMK